MLSWQESLIWYMMPHDWCVGDDETRQMLLHFLRKKHQRGIRCLARSQALNKLAFGTFSGVLGLIDLSLGSLDLVNMPRENNYGRAHWDTISQVRFANAGPILASVGAEGDGNLRLWDIKRRGLLSESGGKFPIRDFVFSPADEFLFCVDSGGRLGKWNLTDGKRVENEDAHNGLACTAIDLDPGGRILATADDNAQLDLPL